jgi:hypothetical protein
LREIPYAAIHRCCSFFNPSIPHSHVTPSHSTENFN